MSSESRIRNLSGYIYSMVECHVCIGYMSSSLTISYPESSGFLVSGWAPVETLARVLEFCYRKISAVKQWKSLQGSQSKNLNFFEFPRVSTGAHPLTKKPEDSGYEIASLEEGRQSTLGTRGTDRHKRTTAKRCGYCFAPRTTRIKHFAGASLFTTECSTVQVRPCF